MPIPPQTSVLDWPAHVSGQVFTGVSGRGLQDNLIFALRYDQTDSEMTNLGGSASDMKIDTTSGSIILSVLGGGIALQEIDGGFTTTEPESIKPTGDYTFCCCIRTPTTWPAGGTLAADWNLSNNENNFIFYMFAGSGGNGTLGYLNGSGGSASDSLAMTNALKPDTFYTIIVQRDAQETGSEIRIWVREKDSEFIYDPGGYDVGNPSSGNNDGEHQIGVAPNDTSTSWEPDYSYSSAYGGGATSNTPRLFAIESGGLPFRGDVFCSMMWDRALSYQEVAALIFYPFRLFTNPFSVVNEPLTVEGIDRYKPTGKGVPVVFGVDQGASSGKSTSLPSLVSELNPELIRKGSWTQQSGINAPGINIFAPQMGYNISTGPDDDRVFTDNEVIDPQGLKADHRRVDFSQAAHYSVNISAGIPNILSIKTNKVALIDLELCFSGNSGSVTYESSKGYYPYFYIEELGQRFGDISRDTDQEIIVWLRPHFIESLRDLDEYAENSYFANADAIAVPFYYNYTNFTNNGTDAKSRIDEAFAANHGNVERRIEYCHYLAETHGIPFYAAVRIDQGGTWGSQSVFDAQMELAMRAGDGAGDLFKGIYMWGGATAIDNAASLLSFWANEGEAAGLYMIPEVTQAINTYELISGIYGQAVRALEDGFDNIFFGLQNVVEIDDPDVKLELLATFRDVYNRFDNGRYSSLTSAAKRLNQHILTVSDKPSINDFLQMSEIMVSSDWATLSALSGYEIDPIYIK